MIEECFAPHMHCLMFSTTLFRIVTPDCSLILIDTSSNKAEQYLLTKFNIEQSWRQTLFSFVSSTPNRLCVFFAVYCDFLIHAKESLNNE